ncbi:glycoside hydrolase family 81 protein [Karstenula rhodostoma CBS 690.94]|uniref:glucan endo-1,3-beta-D-glucosidase n=1 Tax=Karstenula rhodostoma CBS 690.94 TaxID=1392251 RepID=A0A9P4PIT4_9PLEO|nr:glycoside hydrolase family 81 protein [Karstenula rhodostoma CBS 690.94]
MAKLAVLLALVQSTLIYGLPAREQQRDAHAVENRAVEDVAITLSSDLDITTSYSLVVSTLQSVSVTESPSITGVIPTGLPDPGFTLNPIKTDIEGSSQTLAPIDGTLKPGPTKPLNNVEGNVFIPMATDAPPQQVPSRDDHPIKKINIVDGDVPVYTNKFYANLFLGKQDFPVWTHPYSLAWAKGTGDTWGMSVSHVERAQFAWGEQTPPRHWIAPIGIQHIVMSAKELGTSTVLSTEALTGFSVYANLAPSVNSEPVISFPLVQGMGFVTGLYNNAKPQLNSGVFFRTLDYVGRLNGITFKYRITLEDDSHWLLYATPVGSLGAPPFVLIDNHLIEGPDAFVGSIQIAKNPAASEGEQAYDFTAGAFATNATISGTVNGAFGSYTLEWDKSGVQNQTLLMFAIPHQVESFDQASKDALTNIELVTTTKGYARAVVADKITMIEPELPASIGFAPWVPNKDNGNSGSDNIELTDQMRVMVQNSGAVELGQNFTAQTSLDSMYYSGKGLAKFASIIYTVQTLGKDTELAAAGLVKLKDAFNVFINNTQPLPLVYDTVWKGVVSSGSYGGGDLGVDFGNTLYNDHHFHYGYFVYTAAVVGHLDPAWLDQGSNKAWVNMLVRDFANPTADDPYFPFQRSFDWFMCHSWAKGLFDSGDGKDQESTSEDTFATYALKMWANTIGDAYMEGRANLQLACQKRSLRNYFLLEADNQVQPTQFLPNKVTGILFENKVDHTTYFGANPEFIQGIHMIPLNPSSAYTRTRKFVQEEWDAFFSDGRADKAVGGWKGILYANQILIDPFAALEFFSDPNFDMSLLDGGASRTFYLAYAAAMAGGAGGGAVDVTEADEKESQGGQAEDASVQAQDVGEDEDEGVDEEPGEDDDSEASDESTGSNDEQEDDIDTDTEPDTDDDAADEYNDGDEEVDSDGEYEWVYERRTR